MATFQLIKDNIYRVEGALTNEEIDNLNTFKNRTILIIENTKELNSKTIANITNERIIFSIREDLTDQEKTYCSPLGLGLILEYFENNESMINPEWTTLQKAMFIYSCIVEDYDYATNFDDLTKDPESTLNGVLYNKLSCTGFAYILKEAYDRIGIESFYLSIGNKHEFNIIKIDNKYYALDAYKDNLLKEHNYNHCCFSYFGRFDNLLKQKNRTEIENKIAFELSIFSNEELTNNFKAISQAVVSREPKRFDILAHNEEERIAYLPINLIKKGIDDEANFEYLYYIVYLFLKKRNAFSIDNCLVEAYESRLQYILNMNTDYDRIAVDLPDLSISLFGTKCGVTADGTLYNHSRENRVECINEYLDKEIIPEEELNRVISILNLALEKHAREFLEGILIDINKLFASYEPLQEDFDEDRIELEANIRSKFIFLSLAKDYLVKVGYDEQSLISIVERINAKLNK